MAPSAFGEESLQLLQQQTNSRSFSLYRVAHQRWSELMGRGEVAPFQFIALRDILVDPENPCQIGDGNYPHWIDALGTIPIEQ